MQAWMLRHSLIPLPAERMRLTDALQADTEHGLLRLVHSITYAERDLDIAPQITRKLRKSTDMNRSGFASGY